MDSKVASKKLSEQLYILTNCGRNLETQFYYDEFGLIVPRMLVFLDTKRTLPPEYTPAYDLGYMRHLALTKLKNQIRIKNKLKTALYLGEEATCEFLLQMAKQNQFKK